MKYFLDTLPSVLWQNIQASRYNFLRQLMSESLRTFQILQQERATEIRVGNCSEKFYQRWVKIAAKFLPSFNITMKTFPSKLSTLGGN